jgi:pyruvate formate lyase activating enzyme
MLPLVDLWLFDIKLLDDELHRQVTGVSNQLILDNLTRLVASHSKVQVRVPVIPGVNDREQDWQALISLLRPLAIQGIKLLGYHAFGTEKYARLGRPYLLSDTLSPTAERLAEISQLLQAAGLPVI